VKFRKEGKVREKRENQQLLSGWCRVLWLRVGCDTVKLGRVGGSETKGEMGTNLRNSEIRFWNQK